jgi:hypothetical protein
VSLLIPTEARAPSPETEFRVQHDQHHYRAISGSERDVAGHERKRQAQADTDTPDAA